MVDRLDAQSHCRLCFPLLVMDHRFHASRVRNGARLSNVARSDWRRRTALVYPTLLAAIGDVAHPGWRASAVGVYRLWRDLGYAVGALLSGIVADVFGLVWAVVAVGTLTFGSGIVVAVRMRETTATRDIQVQ
jgi:MFS family permease